MNRLAIALLAWLGMFGSVRAAPPIEAYGRLPGVELMRLSPSGERYTAVGVVGEQRRLIVASADGKILHVNNVGTAKVRGIYWAGEDHVLVMLSSTFNAPLYFRQSYELGAVLNIRLSDHQSFAIFDKAPDVAHAVFGYFGSAQVDGHWVGYFGGITYAKTSTPGEYRFDHGYRDLYQVDLDSATHRRVAEGSEKDHAWVIAADGAIVAHSEYDQQSGAWRLYGGRNHDAVLLEKTSPLGELALIGQGRSAGTVLLLDGSGTEDVVAEVSGTQQQREELFGQASVENYLHDPDTGRLIGCTTKEAPHAMLFDPKLQVRFNATRKAFPGLQVELVSFSRNFDRLIVKTDGGDDSGTFWLVDIASGKAVPIGNAYPLVRPVDVGPTQLIKYAATDGVMIEAVLTLPPGHKTQNLPLVVMPHGGPMGVADRLGFDWWAQAYTSAGYAVLQPNYRGSAGYGREFRDAGFGQWGRKMQTDLSDGLSTLAAQGVIDPKRVCIVGASYGGYAALAGVTLQRGLYRCAVSVAGPADMPSFFNWESTRHGYKSDATRYWRAITGADKEGDAAMRVISPTLNAEHADAPILLIHGKDDTVVPIQQSEKMASALKSARKQVEFVVMQGEDHWLSREDTREAMLKAAVAFVKQHNPPD